MKKLVLTTVAATLLATPVFAGSSKTQSAYVAGVWLEQYADDEYDVDVDKTTTNLAWLHKSKLHDAIDDIYEAAEEDGYKSGEKAGIKAGKKSGKKHMHTDWRVAARDLAYVPQAIVSDHDAPKKASAEAIMGYVGDKLDAFETLVENKDDQIAALQAQIATLNANHAAAINELELDIDELEVDIANLEGEVETLEDTVDTKNAWIVTLGTQKLNLENQLTNLQYSIDEMLTYKTVKYKNAEEAYKAGVTAQWNQIKEIRISKTLGKADGYSLNDKSQEKLPAVTTQAQAHGDYRYSVGYDAAQTATIAAAAADAENYDKTSVSVDGNLITVTYSDGTTTAATDFGVQTTNVKNLLNAVIDDAYETGYDDGFAALDD